MTSTPNLSATTTENASRTGVAGKQGYDLRVGAAERHGFGRRWMRGLDKILGIGQVILRVGSEMGLTSVPISNVTDFVTQDVADILAELEREMPSDAIPPVDLIEIKHPNSSNKAYMAMYIASRRVLRLYLPHRRHIKLSPLIELASAADDTPVPAGPDDKLEAFICVIAHGLACRSTGATRFNVRERQKLAERMVSRHRLRLGRSDAAAKAKAELTSLSIEYADIRARRDMLSRKLSHIEERMRLLERTRVRGV